MEPRVENVPGKQVLHAENPADCEKSPAEHGKQIVEPTGEYCPAWQRLQEKAPVERVAKLPAGHGTHMEVAPGDCRLL